MYSFPIQKVYLMAVAILGLGAALLMGSWVGSGNIMLPALVIGGSAGLATLLLLGRHYWYLIPFSVLSGLPAIPLGGRTVNLVEVSIAACSAIFFARLAMKRERLVVFRPTHAVLLLSFAWVCWIWYLNPTGFAALGSGTIGARYYINIILGFLGFLVLASQKPTEEDFRRLLWIVFAGVMISTAYGIFSFFVLGGAEAEASASASAGGLEEYTWHQIIAGPSLIGAYLIFAYNKPSQVFGLQKPLLPILYLLAFGVATLSGKRMSILLILMAPLLGCVINKEYRYALIGMILGGAMLTSLLFAQGSVITLPFTVQRSLSWLPGNWDPSLQELGRGDIFRVQLRELATHEIKRSPLIGRGYATSFSDVLSGYTMMEQGSGLELEKVMGHAASKNWHNRWLGYSADFGIPFAVLLAWLYLTGIIVSWRLTQSSGPHSYARVFSLFAFFWICQQIITSHTSGHTAQDALNNWWLYGLLFATYATRIIDKVTDTYHHAASLRPEPSGAIASQVPTPVVVRDQFLSRNFHYS
jgi:hypothetical protein